MVYKWSSDNVNILEANTLKEILNNFPQQIKALIIRNFSSFTQFDIQSGETVRIPFTVKGKTQYLTIGKNLTKADLAKSYDNWGRLKENSMKKNLTNYNTVYLKEAVEASQEPLSKQQRAEYLAAVGRFNEFGKKIYRNEDLKQMAKDIEEIAGYATKLTLAENPDWFDKVTVNKNVKSLQGTVKEFVKACQEAAILQQRMESLYEDAGHVLSRYFKLTDIQEPELTGMRTSTVSENKLVEGLYKDADLAKKIADNILVKFVPGQHNFIIDDAYDGQNGVKNLIYHVNTPEAISRMEKAIRLKGNEISGIICKKFPVYKHAELSLNSNLLTISLQTEA